MQKAERAQAGARTQLLLGQPGRVLCSSTASHWKKLWMGHRLRELVQGVPESYQQAELDHGS